MTSTTPSSTSSTEQAGSELLHAGGSALELLANCVSALHDGFVVFDQNQVLLICNQAYRDMYAPVGQNWGPGTTMHTVAHDTAKYCIGISDPETLKAWIDERLAGFGVPRPDREQTMLNGRTLLIREHRLDNGYVVGIRIDISVQKQKELELRRAREQALEANLAKSAFLANMSHELRTPLNAIIGFSDIMASEAFGTHAQAKYLEYAADILSSGKHLKSLIDDLLDYGVIEAKGVQLNEANLDLRQLLEECGRQVEPAAEVRGVGVRVVGPEEPCCLRADLRAVRQMVLNLASNAARFSRFATYVDLTFGVEDGAIVLQVLDRGPGVAPDAVPRRSGAVRTDSNIFVQRTSRGLGLRIVDSLCELHGAVLHLGPRDGGGTRARIVFPRDRTASPDASQDRAAE